VGRTMLSSSEKVSMVLRAGFQTFEFLQALELPKPLSFSTADDALKWLKGLAFQHPDLIPRFREYLTRFTEDPETFRLTEQQAMERLAVLLHSRRTVVIAREYRAAGGRPSASTEPAPAFPLSERAPKAPAVTYQPPVNDPPTFNSDIDAAAQANALVAAAADGKPFCPE
jgi:hypothetical protein